MIILDTNVISALMTDKPAHSVSVWLDGCPPESVWTTAVTVYELRTGLERLPASRKRRQLEDQFARVIIDDIHERVLAFDAEAAGRAAVLAALRSIGGITIEIRDTMIGGIALSRKADLATRNVRHFRDLGVSVVDPWAP